MTDEQPKEGAPAQADTLPSGSDQALTGAPKVDLEKAVAELARKNEREARKRVSLDLIDNPEHRKVAEAWTSQQLNEYRRTLEDGKNEDFLRKTDVEAMLRAERKAMRAEQEAVEKHRDLLAEFDIRKGTEDYQKFEAAAGYLDKSKLADREALEMVARATGVGKFKSKEAIPEAGRPFLPSSGISLRAPAVDKATGKPVLDQEAAEYQRLVEQHGKSRAAR